MKYGNSYMVCSNRFGSKMVKLVLVYIFQCLSGHWTIMSAEMWGRKLQMFCRNLLPPYSGSKNKLFSFFDPENWVSMIIQNSGNFLLDYRSSHLRRCDLCIYCHENHTSHICFCVCLHVDAMCAERGSRRHATWHATWWSTQERDPSCVRSVWSGFRSVVT